MNQEYHEYFNVALDRLNDLAYDDTHALRAMQGREPDTYERLLKGQDIINAHYQDQNWTKFTRAVDFWEKLYKEYVLRGTT